MVTEISTTLEVDESLGSAEATGSSGVVCALEHGGEFISPGAGGRQSANAANAKANVRAMAAPSLFRVFSPSVGLWLRVSLNDQGLASFRTGDWSLIGIQRTARPSRSKRLYHPNRKVTLK